VLNRTLIGSKTPRHSYYVGVFLFMKDFSSTLFPCSQLSSIVKYGKAFNIKKNQKLQELLAKPILTLDEADKVESLLEEREACDFLAKSSKSFLIRRYVVEKYYRDIEATPLQMIKGTRVEVSSLDFFCEITSAKHKKNKKKFESDYLIGTPDVVERDTVIEIKSSWDIFTFLNNVKADVNKQYYWQLQGYMSITSKENAELVYCLISTPDEIIEEEYQRIVLRNPSIPADKKFNKKLRDSLFFNMRFDDIPKDERVLRFSVERNDEDISRIGQKVVQAREFLKEFQERHLFFTKYHRKSLLNAINSEVEDAVTED
jgi:hypothetical protein